jgi:hypothetical protein
VGQDHGALDRAREPFGISSGVSPEKKRELARRLAEEDARQLRLFA